MPKKLKEAPAAAPAVEQLSFEQAQAELEEIVSRMEGGALSLEESLALHARGTELAAHCARRLEAAELRVRELRADAGPLASLDDSDDAYEAAADDDDDSGIIE
jgi:exodeoxyribonuclease VII small subunit